MSRVSEWPDGGSNPPLSPGTAAAKEERSQRHLMTFHEERQRKLFQ